MRKTPGTRTEQVYLQLRVDILAGKLLPGSRLRMLELSDRFSVSQSVVREALTRLSEQGLVDALPQQGFRVVTLAMDDLVEITDARVQFEPALFGLAIERGDLAWESSVIAAHHQLAGTSVSRGEVEDTDWLNAHAAFHVALLEGCANSRLLDIARNLREASALYRSWSVPFGHDHDRDIASEHRALMDAALHRDVALGTQLLAAHIRRTTDALRKGSNDQPDLDAFVTDNA